MSCSTSTRQKTIAAPSGGSFDPPLIRPVQCGFVLPHFLGPVAQLGARVNGIHEVTGSIPVWSTKFSFSVLISRK